MKPMHVFVGDKSIYKYIYIHWLVVSTILRNMKVSRKDYPIYFRKKNMFQTTNQYIYMYILIYQHSSHCPNLKKHPISCPKLKAAEFTKFTNRWEHHGNHGHQRTKNHGPTNSYFCGLRNHEIFQQLVI